MLGGNKIFITGASSGIGHALARYYLDEGHTVGVCARDLDKLMQAWNIPKYISLLDSHLFLFEANVIDRDQILKSVESFVSKTGGLDLLVANAGIGIAKKTQLPDFLLAKSIFETNVNGTFNSFEAALKFMLPKNKGHLVAIASLAGFLGLPKNAAYSASKSAILKMCESFSIDFNAFGISVSAIAPGYVSTEVVSKNNYPMPFSISTECAAKKIAKAISYKKQLYMFPFPMKILITFLSVVPRNMYIFLMSYWSKKSLKNSDKIKN